MPNIDTAAQFLILEGNTAGTNGIIQVVGTNTVIDVGTANTANALAGFIELTNGVYMNYGSANANTTGTVITLGYPYAVNVFSVGADSNTVASSLGVTTANTTKITLVSNTTANVLVYWQTWGI